jgi:hypothetical protein
MCLGEKVLEDKDVAVPFDEGSQVVHVVSRHAVYADAGSQLRGVPGDRVQRRNDQRGLECGTAGC